MATDIEILAAPDEASTFVSFDTTEVLSVERPKEVCTLCEGAGQLRAQDVDNPISVYKMVECWGCHGTGQR